MIKFSNRLLFSFRTLYQILDVPQNASQDQIKQNYLKIVKMYHPDTNSQQSKDQEYFKQVTAAYTILSNQNERRKYDQTLNNSFFQKDDFSQQNYDSNFSKHRKEQIIMYIYLAAFILVYLYNQKINELFGIKKLPINSLPNKYIPKEVIQIEKKELTEKDCNDLSLDIIKQKSKRGDYKLGQLCYDRLLLDQQKIIKKKKNLDDFQQDVVNYNNSQVSQKSETILVDQQQPYKIQSPIKQQEQNLENKEKLEEIRENEEQKQNLQQINEEFSDDQTLQLFQELNNNKFENNSEQIIVEQYDQEVQSQQQQSQQESQQEN
ncbi:unnamed protein product [Paramecium pentaurelia]|uniref:J domain-containing protein n=1 Tax=Paramecium pentaurelia TaxID=43138 RepID=A0A8S1TMW0_9CILI|nr:unnamed protein product [Paramecium pentaurelia]